MLTWVIQITMISLVLIFLVHHLINFFKSTLTVPKLKDLVNTPRQNYENIYNIINPLRDDTNENKEYNLIDLVPKNEVNMKSELKNFLKSQLQNSIQDNTIEYTSNSLKNSYSNY